MLFLQDRQKSSRNHALMHRNKSTQVPRHTDILQKK